MAARMDELVDGLVAKWRTPAGVELISEGAKIIGHLMNTGPLPEPLADEMLGASHSEGMMAFFRDRDFDLELDDEGLIVGAGLSISEDDPHVFEIRGKRYHGWCMVDALMFPIVFGAESPIRTACPTTGTIITLKADPNGIFDLEPSGAWFTLAPATGGEIREVFCERVNFYVDQATAEAAVAADPELACGPATQAWDVAKRLADLF
jgi:alkylmercury lyase